MRTNVQIARITIVNQLAVAICLKAVKNVWLKHVGKSKRRQKVYSSNTESAWLLKIQNRVATRRSFYFLILLPTRLVVTRNIVVSS